MSEHEGDSVYDELRAIEGWADLEDKTPEEFRQGIETMCGIARTLILRHVEESEHREVEALLHRLEVSAGLRCVAAML